LDDVVSYERAQLAAAVPSGVAGGVA
jgi:hypothetical protein